MGFANDPQDIEGCLSPEPLPRQQQLENARLIAAAPELFKALKEQVAGMMCVCKLNPLVGQPVPCRTCELNVLIAKAEGKQ